MYKNRQITKNIYHYHNNYQTSELFKLSNRGAVIVASSKWTNTGDPRSSSGIEHLRSKLAAHTSKLCELRLVFGFSLLKFGCSKLRDIFGIAPVLETTGNSIDSNGVSKLMVGWKLHDGCDNWSGCCFRSILWCSKLMKLRWRFWGRSVKQETRLERCWWTWGRSTVMEGRWRE